MLPQQSEFFAEVREVDRDNEVNRILWAFKLNPFEKLNLRFDATPEEVRKQYRKLSLLVHPDKCSHPQAASAFDVLGAAQKELNDEAKREVLNAVLDKARGDCGLGEEVRAERRKETKHDAAVALAATLHERGREGVEEDWEKTDAFHERWKLKARDVMAKSEWRKRKLTKRVRVPG
ncbi:J domain-containing protein spf31 [Monoraphidium neglectum]|uniref:J domain-containing protein spf31 n=1 Tax=Monoraphidium neglectum TaxID=145388 RepID=A0A0D2NP93_9CHLO|nr:J domain-containing protein spf31 [Monoraphidium neglectum]KIZ06236.1 J domain-containing protein spf31 [Monoraphidium neglectum]|eukprot:XP_013905255.1 J domain-containing protein spf31 [Monoraphidium neglectum]